MRIVPAGSTVALVNVMTTALRALHGADHGTLQVR